MQKIFIIIDPDGLAIASTAALLRGAAIDRAATVLDDDWATLLDDGYRVAEVTFTPIVCDDQRESADE